VGPTGCIKIFFHLECGVVTVYYLFSLFSTVCFPTVSAADWSYSDKENPNALHSSDQCAVRFFFLWTLLQSLCMTVMSEKSQSQGVYSC
jgi:hypothetical protein